MGRGMGMGSGGSPEPSMTPEGTSFSGGTGEVSALRQEVQEMTRQLGEVLERLRRLEKG